MQRKKAYLIIQTTKDIIFGGFASQEWGDNNKDENSFVYSLKKKI